MRRTCSDIILENPGLSESSRIGSDARGSGMRGYFQGLSIAHDVGTKASLSKRKQESIAKEIEQELAIEKHYRRARTRASLNKPM